MSLMRLGSFCLIFAFALGSMGVVDAKPNVLLLFVDDLRPELRSFGATHMKTPNIDQLAATGRAFHRHYVQAPTCGASRYTALTGRYGPYGNGALLRRGQRLLENPDSEPPSLPAFFRNAGYTTVSVGKVSHHPGGRGGRNWDDDSELEMPFSWDRHLLPAGPWSHPRGAMHGLARGEIRRNAKDMDVLQAGDGDDSIYPDGLIVDEGLRQLESLSENASESPFFLAVGIIRPHLPFGAPKKYFDLYEEVEFPKVQRPERPTGITTWHRSGEFMKYNRWSRNPNEDAEFSEEVRRAYAACVSYADALVGKMLDRLETLGHADDTILVLWGDHGWHLGEHSIWGKHALFEESLRSPLIIRYPGIQHPGAASDSIVETVDLFPTLCDLAGFDVPNYVDGESLRPILENPDAPGDVAVSYTNAKTLRTDRYRLIAHPSGDFELYDHESDAGETENIAGENPEIVEELGRRLSEKLGEPIPGLEG